jgi:putative redox protein
VSSQAKLVFPDITVEHIVTGYHLNPDAVARAIELSETRYCGAGAMLGRTARLKHTYRLIQLETEPVTHP